ncbi:Brp/Blh family beta-carotene 15,15'-monooxygenase [Candidatus Vecturithrix granuli]|uniref:Brp/Blh family beta-carotene 15,15'-monooxygenase n=1 Tax=Vecturithrix granuli TaxID=1499967 RepID=A0A0S6W9S6_VECG1|nr:Brp/Blh family beta-carotene 15,15'-monooxygenase [Candidatus Vecturithrix granuli]
MGIADIEKDLKFIRQTMESSSRYTNVPASGYLAAGFLGLIGVWGTYLLLGDHKILNITLITPKDIQRLMLLWLLVFVSALSVVMFCAWHKARKHGHSAWNSLAARMFLSQTPVIFVAGVLSVALTREGYLDLIPGVWLGIYGTILYSFSYFTGVEHKIEGAAFIALGTLVLFVQGKIGLFLMGLGFGGIHLVAGCWRLFLERQCYRK